MSVRQLAKDAGVSDAHLSRVLRGVNYKSPSGDLTRRVALALGLSEDYFPEFREAFVLERVRATPSLREQLYTRLTRRS
jgi:transcriptional regulator with XRE-family HTH domain